MKLLFGLAVAGVLCAEPVALKRLDGSTISFAEAESFARDVLRKNGVTGAQIGFVDGGRLVWARGFGLRRVDPPLPIRARISGRLRLLRAFLPPMWWNMAGFRWMFR